MGYRAAALEAGTSWPAVAAEEEAGMAGEGGGKGGWDVSPLLILGLVCFEGPSIQL